MKPHVETGRRWKSVRKSHAQDARIEQIESRLLMAAGASESFGSGIVLSTATESRAVAIQKDGKVVIASTSSDSLGIKYVSVARFNTSGTLDTSFNDIAAPSTNNGDGKIGFYFGHFTSSVVSDIEIASDGKILIVGTNTDSGSFRDIAVVRLNSNGTLDKSFSGDGALLVNVGMQSSGSSIKIANDGKIVVGGQTVGTDIDGVVARITTAGVLDTTFDSDGFKIFDWGSFGEAAIDTVSDLEISPASGKISVVGVAAGGNLGIAKFNTNGTFDTTFNGTGKRTALVGGNIVSAELIIDPVGQYYVAYATPFTTTPDFAIRRYTTGGAIDSTFGVVGVATIEIYSGTPGKFAVLEDFIQQKDDKFILTGSINNPSGTINNPRSVVVRANANGTKDLGFDGDGFKQLGSLGIAVTGVATGVALDGDGTLFVTSTGLGARVQAYKIDGGQYPFRGAQLWNLSETIGGENFDLGGPGDSYVELSPTYDTTYRGGYMDIPLDLVAGVRSVSISAGEQAEWSTSLAVGTYKLDVRLASGIAAQLQVFFNGVAGPVLSFPAASSWTTFSMNVTTTSANPVVTLKALTGAPNVDWLRFTYAGQLSGYVFNDTDGDDIKDAGESYIAGRTIYLDQNNNLVRDASELSTTTDSTGTYRFTNLPDGFYKIRQILPSGWEQTYPNSGFGQNATITAGSSISGKNFGSRPIAPVPAAAPAFATSAMTTARDDISILVDALA